ncbi:MAG: hypothetical protein Q8L36_03355 [bacterium]|nr:hypothetical protein [bacterium]
MIENFDDIIIPGPAEVPPTPEAEKKPEVVLEAEEKERILGDLEKFKEEERSGERNTFHLVENAGYPEIDFAGLKNEDLKMADTILRGADDSALDSLGKEFDAYRHSISGDSNRSHFAAFLGNTLQKSFNVREAEKMRAEIEKGKEE